MTEVATTAGGRLRAAREAAGLSVDAVAQQLKLAPRQVTALEEDDWQGLPGRTFIRGFARNYARFVRLDPDAVLALLPAPETAPALERPALRSSSRPMGEIPAARESNAPAWRWLLPLVIVAIIVAVAYYELSRSSLHLPGSLSLRGMGTSETQPAATPAATDASTQASGSEAPASAPSSSAALALTPKVVDGTSAPSAADAPASNAAVPATSEPSPAGTTTSPAAAPTEAATPTPAGDAPLVLTFRGTSWAEVKDASGRVVLQMTGGPGMTQTVDATPPLELALGNAPAVGVTFRGQPLDLGRYTRGTVARVGLK